MLFLLVLSFPLVLWSVGAQLSLYFALILLYLNDLPIHTRKQTLVFSVLSLPILIFSFSEWSIIGGVLTLLLFPIFEWIILPGCLLLFLGCFAPIPKILSNTIEFFFLLEKFLQVFTFPNFTIGKPSFFLFLLLLIVVLLIIDRLKYHQSIYLFLITAFFFSAQSLYQPTV